jgi:hypothetical protein
MLHLSRFTAVSSLAGDESPPLLVYRNPLRNDPTHQRCPGRDSLPEVLSRVGPHETSPPPIRPKQFHSALCCYGICSGHPWSVLVYKRTTTSATRDLCRFVGQKTGLSSQLIRQFRGHMHFHIGAHLTWPEICFPQSSIMFPYNCLRSDHEHNKVFHIPEICFLVFSSTSTHK